MILRQTRDSLAARLPACQRGIGTPTDALADQRRVLGSVSPPPAAPRLTPRCDQPRLAQSRRASRLHGPSAADHTTLEKPMSRAPELLFIDPAVADLPTLLRGVRPEVEPIVLDGRQPAA